MIKWVLYSKWDKELRKNLLLTRYYVF